MYEYVGRDLSTLNYTGSFHRCASNTTFMKSDLEVAAAVSSWENVL